MDKNILKERLLSLEAGELEGVKEAYDDYVAGARVDGSEPIENQEQSQAEQARDLSEAFDAPVHSHLHKLEILKTLDFSPKSKIEEGAVVKFGDRYFVIAVATAVFSCEGREVMGISPSAPIYSEIEGLSAGDSFEFRGRRQLIQEVL